MGAAPESTLQEDQEVIMNTKQNLTTSPRGNEGPGQSLVPDYQVVSDALYTMVLLLRGDIARVLADWDLAPLCHAELQQADDHLGAVEDWVRRAYSETPVPDVRKHAPDVDAPLTRDCS